jgi:hypothetical protein
MNISRYLLCGLLAILISGCGQTVKESLKIAPVKKSAAGTEKTIVVLPFADYSEGDDIATAYHRSLYIGSNLTDQLVSNSFTLPVDEDVFLYLVQQDIINVTAYENINSSTLENEMQDADWSDVMKSEVQRYADMANNRHNNKSVQKAPGTHGLTQQEIVKIGRHFSADYIMRGRIIQYKTRQDPSWSPMKKGIIGFITGSTNKLAFGQAKSDKYDNWGNMLAGGMYGAIAGNSWANGPWNPDGTNQLFGSIDAAASNAIVWGAVGAGLGHMAHNTGDAPQAVVQLRIWVQDAYTGDVVWTNRVDVKVSPETMFADYQYDQLFESATEKAVETLIDDFSQTL